MIFTEIKLKGAYIIDIERREDQRGFFARVWCAEEFEAHGLNPHILQSNIGFSARKGTLRGMHFQVAPHAEVKLLRCTMGAVYDVIYKRIAAGEAGELPALLDDLHGFCMLLFGHASDPRPA